MTAKIGSKNRRILYTFSDHQWIQIFQRQIRNLGDHFLFASRLFRFYVKRCFLGIFVSASIGPLAERRRFLLPWTINHVSRFLPLPTILHLLSSASLRVFHSPNSSQYSWNEIPIHCRLVADLHHERSLHSERDADSDVGRCAYRCQTD
jgi:hypothetical protein